MYFQCIPVFLCIRFSLLLVRGGVYFPCVFAMYFLRLQVFMLRLRVFTCVMKPSLTYFSRLQVSRCKTEEDYRYEVWGEGMYFSFLFFSLRFFCLWCFFFFYDFAG